jgi:hypothetical protein
VLEGEEAVRKKAEMENMFSRRGKKRKMVHFNFLGEIKKQTMAYYHDRSSRAKIPSGGE